MVKELKRVSNLWLKKHHGLSNFERQDGYADFSLSESNLEQVKRYIANQEQHHRKISFQDELRALLQRHRINGTNDRSGTDATASRLVSCSFIRLQPLCG